MTTIAWVLLYFVIFIGYGWRGIMVITACVAAYIAIHLITTFSLWWYHDKP